MTNQQIDKLLEAYASGNIDKLITFIDDEQLKNQLENFFSSEYSEYEGLENQRLLLINLMHQIEKEGYEYFYEKAIEESDIARTFFPYMENKDNLTNVLNDERFGFFDYTKYEAIKKTQDIEYIKSCIETRKVVFDEEMRHKVYLINEIDDSEYVKKFIQDNETALDYDGQLPSAVAATRDSDYITNFYENNKGKLELSQAVNLIKAINKTEYTERFISDYPDLMSNVIFELIYQLNDSEYKYSCITESKFDLSSDYILELLYPLEDNYKKDYIEKGMLSSQPAKEVELLLSMNDKEYLKGIVQSDKFNTYSRTLKLKLLFATEDLELMESYQNYEKIGKKITAFFELTKSATDSQSIPYEYKTIKLPPNMTIGMEIESEGNFAAQVKKFFNFYDWKAKEDPSLIQGVEIVSPILYATSKDSAQIYQVNKALNEIGFNTSERCGGHIHIGANYLTTQQSYINLMEIWCNTEKILYSICNELNEAPRGGMPHYAKPISPKVQEALDSGSINLTDDLEVDEFIANLKQVQIMGEGAFTKRYSGLNFLNINNGKNTIEFRLANGTINPDLWIDNINLFGGIVAISEELAQIQQKGIENDEDRSKIEMLGRLKEDISEEDKLKILLELVGVEPEAYMERYESNMRLMDNEQERKEAFEKVKGPIDIIKKSQISSKDIAQATVSASALMEQEAISTIVKEMEHEKQQENVAERT